MGHDECDYVNEVWDLMTTVWDLMTGEWVLVQEKALMPCHPSQAFLTANVYASIPSPSTHFQVLPQTTAMCPQRTGGGGGGGGTWEGCT